MIKAVSELAEQLGYKIIYRRINKELVAKGEVTYYCTKLSVINISEKYKDIPFIASLNISKCICLFKLYMDCNSSKS